MPRFNEQEKAKIRLDLQQKGKHLFSVFGLKKTSIADLTKAAGIAQGTFYLFYSSKEELYFELVEQEEEAIRGQLGEAYFSGAPLTRESFKQFLRDSLETMECNPFLRQLYDEELMEALFRKLPADKLETHFAKDADDLLPVIQEGQREGWIRSRDPEAIVSLIRSFILLSLQKHLIGSERYRETMELFIDLIADGLIIERPSEEVEK
ncbi:TetR/AcrR family transcriptional regulator [Paenibacillus sp. DMB20]|uniref:TetR/AcrR family transcriptional regulator n=1 Tax=Paenibacillus sp. DMB20 TaxID=1642570 RepID=UPI000628249B|nr:TetR/AcrR family transcriptional regulator [Paenibacillus sp. DMB20]KKO54200.1 TetR family transcriptional regulator [Paenibacillus sp. DMB20]